MAYASENFKTKKALKEAVKNGEQISVWQYGPFGPKATPFNGNQHGLEGPWYPEPHRWYAIVEVDENDVITKVK